MGPTPVLSDYQAAAQAQYEPQLEADITTGKANTAAAISNLESSKGQINTDYTSAIENLQNSVQAQSAQINQLYSSRLLGNFSGLQGNDMGMMFSKANQQQATIESTRANKLADIATQETNAQNQELASESALKSKYQGLEAGSASSAYNSAQKAYESQQLSLAKMNQSQANSDRSYQLSLQKLGNSQAAAYKVKQGSQGQYMFTGADGSPVSMAEYVQGKGGNGQTVLNFLANGTSYDKNIYNQLKKQSGNITNDQQLFSTIAKLDKNNYYGFGASNGI